TPPYSPYGQLFFVIWKVPAYRVPDQRKKESELPPSPVTRGEGKIECRIYGFACVSVPVNIQHQHHPRSACKLCGHLAEPALRAFYQLLTGPSSIFLKFVFSARSGGAYVRKSKIKPRSSGRGFFINVGFALIISS
ncbi:MAG: hypothetical protein J6X34_11260, partial [Clostridia bacterium]|nr:hypothetical protein [Clostridia bacterium]